MFLRLGYIGSLLFKNELKPNSDNGKAERSNVVKGELGAWKRHLNKARATCNG